MAEARTEKQPLSRIIIGDKVPLTSYLKDLKTGEKISISQIYHVRELGSAPAVREQFHVVLVSFFEDETAKQWIQNVDTNFPMYIDPELDLYDIFGFSKTVNVKAQTIFKLVKVAVKTRSIPLLTREIPLVGGRDISGQLGGNLIVDMEGKIVYLYRSARPDDRPAIAEILKS